MADVVKIAGIAKERIASICGVPHIKRVVGVDFLVIIFGSVMGFLFPDDLGVADGHTVDGEGVVSGDSEKYIATVSKDHADGAQLVSGAAEVVMSNPDELVVKPESTPDTLVVLGKVETGEELITDQGSCVAGDVTNNTASSVINNTSGTSYGPQTAFSSSRIYTGVGFTPTKSTIKNISFYASSVTGDVTVKAAVFANDWETQIGEWGAEHTFTATGKHTIPVGPNLVSSGAPCTILVKTVTHNDNYVNCDEITASEFPGIESRRGSSLPLPSGSVNEDWKIEIEEETVEYIVDISAAAFSAAPTTVFRKPSPSMKLGYGVTGEHIGPEEVLTLGTGSTESSLVFESSESIKDKIFTIGGSHNTLICDAVEVEVTEVSENTSTVSDTYEQAGSQGDAENTAFWSGVNLIVPNGARVTHLGMSNTGVAASGDIILYRVDEEATDAHTAGGSYVIVAKAAISYSGSGSYEYTELGAPYDIPEDGKEYRIGVKLSSGPFGRISGSGIHSTSISGSVGETFLADLDTYEPMLGAKSDYETYTTTATLTAPLASVPTEVKIPNRLFGTPCNISAEIVPEGLRLKGEKIVFPDNPSLRSMAMAVKVSAGKRVQDFKITPERMG